MREVRVEESPEGVGFEEESEDWNSERRHWRSTSACSSRVKVRGVGGFSGSKVSAACE